MNNKPAQIISEQANAAQPRYAGTAMICAFLKQFAS
jgi:hypothetical protein